MTEIIKTSFTHQGEEFKEKSDVFEIEVPADLMEQQTYVRTEKLHGSVIRIAYLCDFPEYCGIVSRWLYYNLINNDVIPPDYENDPDYIRFHTGFTNNYKTKFPIRLVVISDKKCVGTVTLINNDFPGKSYGPWLGGLFVDTQYRSRGIGKLLLEEGIKIIKDLGYHELYLTTHTANRYYKRLRWQSYEFCKSDDGFDEEIFRSTIT